MACRFDAHAIAIAIADEVGKPCGHGVWVALATAMVVGFSLGRCLIGGGEAPKVTFRDPDSARMACMDPYPVIDGRRANCNLAILGRPGPAVPFGPIRPVIPYNGGAAVPGGMYVPSPTYQQPPYNYSQALVYPPYGPSTYGPEYLYPQNAYGPYVGQQYVPVYGGPRTVGPAVYPYGQFGQPVPSDHSYSPGYVPGHLLPLSNQNAANARASAGAPRPQQQLLLPARVQQFPPNNVSEQMSG
ncbi:unnamed protein product [Triticum turgidum subsp. durum]|uniref:Uncharacterized protein n=1 Tax=Triticum turgidum subsp. durum TaxID=4567 RepID=A0A9R0ZIS1_TRITD|nr:unnamed protein product [Triticum turgidum subsp. durum]